MGIESKWFDKGIEDANNRRESAYDLILITEGKIEADAYLKGFTYQEIK